MLSGLIIYTHSTVRPNAASYLHVNTQAQLFTYKQILGLFQKGPCVRHRRVINDLRTAFMVELILKVKERSDSSLCV